MSTELTLTNDSLDTLNNLSSTNSALDASGTLAAANFFANSLVDFSLSTASSSSVGDVITSLDEVEGTLILQDGVLVSDLTTPFGDIQQSYNLVTLATDFNESFQNASGTLNLANGVASGTLLADGNQFAGSFEFADFVSSFVTDVLKTLDGSASFENGELVIDTSTIFGDVEGTISFNNGQFVSNLTTPFGVLDFSFDFPDDAQYSVPIPQLGGLESVLNLATGQVEIDLFALSPGPEFVVPLSYFNGDVSFNNGIATWSIAIGSEQVTTQINLAEEIGEELNELLTSATGTLTVNNGQLGADLTTSVGDFDGVLNVSQWINDFIATIPDYDGVLTLADGLVTADLTTPYGDVNTTVEYGSYLDDIASFVNNLNQAAIA